MKACKECGSISEPKTVTKGSIWIEVVLWLCFIIPGLIYSIWRHATRHDACRVCGSTSIVPLDTPVGRELAARNPSQVPPPLQPSKNAVALGRAVGRMFARK